MDDTARSIARAAELDAAIAAVGLPVGTSVEDLISHHRANAAFAATMDTMRHFPLTLAAVVRQCKHEFHHPGIAGSSPHSCDGCWCDDERDQDRGWPTPTRQPAAS